MSNQYNSPNRAKLYCSVFIADLLFVPAGSTIAWPSPVITMLKLNTFNGSLVGSTVSIGVVVGLWSCALLLNCIGARSTIMIDHVIFVISFMIFLSSKMLGVLIAGRVVGGLAYGICLNIVPIFITEIADDKLRQACKSLVFFFSGIGQLISFSVGNLGNYMQMQLAAAATSLLAVFILFIIPHSPIWLVKKNKSEAAVSSLCWYRGLQREDVLPELASIKTSVEANKLSKTSQNSRNIIKSVFREYNQRRALLYGCIILTFQVLTGYFVVVTYLHPVVGSQELFIMPMAHIAMIFAGVAMFSALVSTVVVILFGIRKTLAICYIGMGISMVPIAVFMVLHQFGYDVTRFHFISLVSLMVYSAFFATGGGHLPRALMAEISPPLSQGVILALCGTLDWIINFLLLLMVPWLKDTDMNLLWVAFCSFAFLAIIGGIIILVVVPETKGMTVQEIQEMMNKRKNRPSR